MNITRNIINYCQGDDSYMDIVCFYGNIEDIDDKLNHKQKFDLFNLLLTQEIGELTYPAHVNSEYDCTGQLFGSRWEMLHSQTIDSYGVYMRTYLHSYSRDI